MSRSKKIHKKSAFLLKTYEILENQSFKNIISWSPDGIGFIVHNTSLFAQSILPIYFKHSNFHSFIRQLNMYGFSKKRTPKFENYYYNPKFCEGKIELIAEIQRRVQKKNPRQGQMPISSHKSYKDSEESSKNLYEFSIELESKQEEDEDKSDNEDKYDKICLQFYALLKVNNLMLTQQAQYLFEMLKDVKSIASDDYEQVKEFEEDFKEYVMAHSKLRQELMSQSQRDFKNSEKYIKSLSALETQSALSGLSGRIS